MVRTDDDSWDITEGVGQTALGVAMARAEETTTECPLFTDPYAQLFLDAASERGWQQPPSYMIERIRAISAYAASRTKWFDEFFIAAGASGIEQSVILAAGLDSRAWRLPWVDNSAVYEIDQPKAVGVQGRNVTRKRRRVCCALRRGAFGPATGLAGSVARSGFRREGTDSVGGRRFAAVSACRCTGPAVRAHPSA